MNGIDRKVPDIQPAPGKWSMVAAVLRVLFAREATPSAAESALESSAEAAAKQRAELLKWLAAGGF